MNRAFVAIGLGLTGLALPGCQAIEPAEVDARRQSDSLQAQTAILRWYESIEGESEELRAVVEFGELAVPMLDATITDGLSPARREQVKLRLERLSDDPAFIRRGMERTRRRYVSRAKIARAAIEANRERD